jgi:hypothetical protein
MAAKSVIKRREFLGVLGGAAIGWPKIAEAQRAQPKQASFADGPRKIRAVAIGASQSKDIKDATPNTLKGVRPYIKGLINWLGASQGPPTPEQDAVSFAIGTDYYIEYRECEDTADALQASFADADGIILCMSTGVANAAVTYVTAHPSPALRVVGIVSDPRPYFDKTYMCGVSAKRPVHAPKQYAEFVKKLKKGGKFDKNKKIYALHKADYEPSKDSKNWLGKKATYKENATTADIQTQITQIRDAGDFNGMLILPADRFFGAASNIVRWADGGTPTIPTFWSISDYPENAFGGYGFGQELCGRYLAERIAYIWTHGNAIPDDPVFTQVDEDDINWKPQTAKTQRLRKRT